MPALAKNRTTYKIDQCGLYQVRGKRQLSDRLLTSFHSLQELANSRSSLYREWDVPKASGGTRFIESPLPQLKRVQARIATLLMRVEPPTFLYCPVKGRDFVMNALLHARARSIWCIDVKDYFRSTTVESVRRFYSDALGISDDLAWLLTKISTHNGHLPTGSPLSPILAYYSNEPMWNVIQNIVRAHSCHATLYMDDLTVSGTHLPWTSLCSPIRRTLNDHGFYGHKEKFAPNQPAIVTGIMVGIGRSVLPPAHYKRFRERLVAAETSVDPEEAARAQRSANGMRELQRLVNKRRSSMRATVLP